MSIKHSPLILGTEPIGKLLTKFAIPSIIAMTASSLYNMTDSIFIGHGVGCGHSRIGIDLPVDELGGSLRVVGGRGSIHLGLRQIGAEGL